jgi:hypothetical protein
VHGNKMAAASFKRGAQICHLVAVGSSWIGSFGVSELGETFISVFVGSCIGSFGVAEPGETSSAGDR